MHVFNQINNETAKPTLTRIEYVDVFFHTLISSFLFGFHVKNIITVQLCKYVSGLKGII